MILYWSFMAYKFTTLLCLYFITEITRFPCINHGSPLLSPPPLGVFMLTMMQILSLG